MIRRPPRSTLSSSSAASDVYKRQVVGHSVVGHSVVGGVVDHGGSMVDSMVGHRGSMMNSMVHRGSMVDSMCAMVHSMGSVDRAWQQIAKTHMNL